MHRYIIRRLLLMIFVFLAVVLLVFTLGRLSGDPIPAILGENYTEADYEAMYLKLGFDKPYVVQYLNYIKGVVTELDLGTSYLTKMPVRDEVILRLPTSFKLAMLAVLWASLVGIPLGVIAAARQYSVADYSITTAALIQGSIPISWAGIMLMYIIGYKLKWLPSSGLDSWQHYILPCLSLGFTSVAHNFRMTRTSMLEVVRQDYIRTARSKGLNEFKVIVNHAFHNAAIPVITHVGGLIATTIGATTLVETVYGITGLGSYIVSGITNNDFPVVQGCVLVLSVFVVVCNFIVDLLYAAIDPRIKAKYMSTGKVRAAKKQIKAETEVVK